MHSDRPTPVVLTSPPGLMTGIRTALRGLRRALGNADVRRAYRRLVAVIFVVCVVLATLMIGGLWWWTSVPADTSLWFATLMWVLRLAGSLIALIATPMLGLFTVNIVFPMLAEDVFFAGLRAVDPQRAAALEAREGMSVVSSMWMTVTRMIYFLGLTVGSVCITLIPVVGAVAGPALQLWGTARVMSWELLDPYFDKRDMKLQAQKEFVARRTRAMVGFGMPAALVMAIPFAGPLMFGLVQAAAGDLLVTIDPNSEGVEQVPLPVA
ncbi:MAG: EI24 domain-containing protein [Nannocystaceae bacterium]